MLPDLPRLKEEIAQQFHLILINRVNAYLGVVGELPHSIIKEGQSPVIVRPDNSRDETKLQSASTEFILKSEEIPNISVQARIAKIDEAAREMARQISTQAFATITEIVDKVGNVVDGGGKPLSPESFLEFAIQDAIGI